MEYKSRKFIYTIVFIFLFCFAIISELYGIGGFNDMGEQETSNERYASENSINDIAKRYKTAPQLNEQSRKDILKVLESGEKIQGEKRPWRILYSSRSMLILYKYPCILGYSLDSANIGIYAALNILDLDPRLNWKYSDVKVNSSPNGVFCIIGKEENDGENSINNIYLYNFKDNKKTVIGNGEMKNLMTAWSLSSQFYVFTGKLQGEVTLYDTMLNTKKQIQFKKGETKSIFVSDSGDILIDTGKKYIIKKDSLSEQILTKIQGDLVSFSNDEIIYFKDGGVYSYNSNKSSLIKNIGVKLGLETNSYTGASFSSDVSLVGFNNNERTFFTYNVSTKEKSKVYNSSYKRYAVSDESESIKIVEHIGKIHNIPKDSLSEVGWLDDDNLVIIKTNSETRNSPEFEIMRYNIEENEKYMIN